MSGKKTEMKEGESPMQDKLAAVEARYSQIEAQLAANETYSDPDLVSRLNKEQRGAGAFGHSLSGLAAPEAR